MNLYKVFIKFTHCIAPYNTEDLEELVKATSLLQAAQQSSKVWHRNAEIWKIVKYS